MKAGQVMTLVDKVKHAGDGIVFGYELKKGFGVRVLLLSGVDRRDDKPFDLDVAMAALGWVRKPL